MKLKRWGKLQFSRKGHLERAPAWVLGNAGLRRNVYFAWLLDGNKEAKGFIWQKKQRLMRERGRNSPCAACSASTVPTFYPLGPE